MDKHQTQIGDGDKIYSFLRESFSNKPAKNGEQHRKLRALMLAKDYFHETIEFKRYTKTWKQFDYFKCEQQQNQNNRTYRNDKDKHANMDKEMSSMETDNNHNLSSSTAKRNESMSNSSVIKRFRVDGLKDEINLDQTASGAIRQIVNKLQTCSNINAACLKKDLMRTVERQQGSDIKQYMQSDKFNSNKIIGLINTGTNCHANSVIQCLIRCEPIRSWMLEYSNDKCRRPSIKYFCCFCSLRAVFRRFETTTQSFYGTRMLIRGLTSTTNVNFFGQSDANEFALLLLDKLTEHYDKYHKETSIQTTNFDMAKKSSSIDTTFNPADLYTLKIKHVYRCLNCKELRSVVESHSVIHLTSFGKDALSNQLAKFIYQSRPRQKCVKCQRFLQQYSYIKHSPSVLIFAIPRVNSYLLKTKQSFSYEHKISLSSTEFIRESSKCQTGNSPQQLVMIKPVEKMYNLSAVIIHSGKQSSGHYSVIVRSTSSSGWSVISDEISYQIRENEVFCRNDATLLIYNVINSDIMINESLHAKCGDNRFNKEQLLDSTHQTDDLSSYLNCTPNFDENNQSEEEFVDLSLPVANNSLFKMGCLQEKDNITCEDEDDIDCLDYPQKRKRTKKSDLVNTAFHEYVHG